MKKKWYRFVERHPTGGLTCVVISEAQIIDHLGGMHCTHPMLQDFLKKHWAKKITQEEATTLVKLYPEEEQQRYAKLR